MFYSFTGIRLVNYGICIIYRIFLKKNGIISNLL
jgi:hypothetical protein